jgi:hypothetical protein
MSGRCLPVLADTRQLLRLRARRGEGARAAGPAAVCHRQQQVARVRAEQDALVRTMAQGFDGGLARWSRQLIAQRDKLADRLERDEYALLGDERAVQEAENAAAQSRVELSRALAREDSVRGLLGRTQQAWARQRDQQAEAEQEDLRSRGTLAHTGAGAGAGRVTRSTRGPA